MRVVVVGATGLVGRTILEELPFFVDESVDVTAFASENSAGREVKCGKRSLKVKAWDPCKVSPGSLVLMSAGGNFSRCYAEILAEKGCIVIDNSSFWRMKEHVPLVIPEVNIETLKGMKQGIIANPNCSTIQMVMSLKPLVERFGLESVVVSTYQSVSGSGQGGIEELRRQTDDFIAKKPLEASLYPAPIAFNLLPSIGEIDSSGHCEEERKMVEETRKILGHSDLDISATTVRVPVFHCHGEAINVKLSKEVNLNDVLDCFSTCSSVVLDEGGHADRVCNLSHQNKPQVIVSRVRLPYGCKNSKRVQFWNLADNLRKGAATNALQILHYFMKNL